MLPDRRQTLCGVGGGQLRPVYLPPTEQPAKRCTQRRNRHRGNHQRRLRPRRCLLIRVISAPSPALLTTLTPASTGRHWTAQ